MTVAAHKNRLPFSLLAVLFMASAATTVLTGQFAYILLPFALLLFIAGWNYPEMAFLLLLAALPFSAEYIFPSGIGTDIPDEFLMIMVSFLFLVKSLAAPTPSPGRMVIHPLVILLAVYTCWMILCVAFSADRWVSVKFLLAKTWYIGAFVLAPLWVFRNKKMICLAGTVFIVSLMGVMLIILYRHSQTGFSFATANEAVAPFFRNHVNYSAMLACGLPVLLAIYRLVNNQSLKKLAVAAILLTLAALFFSYARGAWLALPAGLLGYWLIRKKFLVQAFLIGLFIVVALLFRMKSNDRYLAYAHDYQTTIFHRDFSQHLVSTYQLKDLSTAERFYRWIAGVRMIKDKGLTGFGPGTFYPNYKSYTVPAFKTWVSDNPERSTVHNYFLLTAVEQGIPGLIFFLLLLGAMLYYAQHLYHRVAAVFYKTLSAMLGVMLVMIIVLNFLSDLVETDKIGSLFFLCLSLLIVIDADNRKLKSHCKTPV